MPFYSGALSGRTSLVVLYECNMACCEPRRRIHAQGDLDGACFLYALGNAYTALTGQIPEPQRWDRAIGSIKHPVDFLKPCVGTTDHYEKDLRLLEDAAISFLDHLAGTQSAFRVQRDSEADNLEGLASLVDSKSVAVFWHRGATEFVDQGDHWVCAVAAEETPLVVHVACSIRHGDDGRFNDRRYVERFHESLNRYSNDSVREEHAIRIMQGFVLQIASS